MPENHEGRTVKALKVDVLFAGEMHLVSINLGVLPEKMQQEASSVLARIRNFVENAQRNNWRSQGYSS